MEAVSEWVYRRFRRHHVLAIMVATTVFVLAFVGIPMAFAASWWLELTASEFLWVSVIVGSVIAVSGALAAASIWKPYLRHHHRWAIGDESTPGTTWRAVQQTSTQGALRAALFATPMVFGVGWAFTPFSSAAREIGWVGIGLASTVAIFASAGVVAIGIPTLIRPLGKEVFEHTTPEDLAEGRTIPVLTRLVLGVAVVASSAVFLGGAVVTRVDSRSGQLFLVLLLAVLLAVYLSVLAYFAILAPTLRPIDDLAEAAERVATGDFSQQVPVTTADEFGRLAMAFNDMQRGLDERERLRSAFGSYVDPVLASRLVEEKSSVFQGEEVHCTILFADIRRFTSFAESVGPRDAVARLNEFFELIVPIVHDHRGHANKFTGDGILAAFGVPEWSDGHADDALAAAVHILDAVRETFDGQIELGIGLHTGPVVAGTIGGGGKLEFTLIGDTVNTAARIENLTKVTGDPILLSQATFEGLSQQISDVQPRGEHPVQGKTDELAVYTVAAS